MDFPEDAEAADGEALSDNHLVKGSDRVRDCHNPGMPNVFIPNSERRSI